MKKYDKFYNMASLPVDAGNIGVIASDKTEHIDKDTSVIDLGAPGEYKIQVKLPRCWLGARQKTRKIKTRTGKVVVGDLCYVFNEGWDKYLNDTEYLNKDTDYSFSVNTGGDGRFEVNVFAHLIKEYDRNFDF